MGKVRLFKHIVFGVILLGFTLFAYLYFDLPKFATPSEEIKKEIFLNTDISWEDVGIESTTILTDLIQIPTIRKDELKAALYLQRFFRKEGIASKIIPHPKRPDKASVIAEIGPEESEKGVILLNHLDVVEVNEAEWSVKPFSAEMKNGEIFGRGALDMKGMLTMQLMAFITLHRTGYPLKNKVMFLAVPDEESGGELGAKFLLEKHEELFEGYQYVLNEGGFGIKDFPFHGNEFFNIQTSEKGIISAEVIAKSKSGHGSMPENKYSSLALMKFIMELQSLQKVSLIPQALEFFHHLSQFYTFPKNFLLQRVQNPLVQYFVTPMLKKNRATNAMITNTVSITGLDTDSKGPNVIPAEAKAILDIRTLPGENSDIIIKDLKELASKYGSTVVINNVTQASESSSQTELYDMLHAVVKDNFPKSQITPYLSPGATDSRFFREKGFICYGLIPILITMEDVGKLHGKDESISVQNLIIGTKILFETIVAFNQIQE